MVCAGGLRGAGCVTSVLSARMGCREALIDVPVLGSLDQNKIPARLPHPKGTYPWTRIAPPTVIALSHSRSYCKNEVGGGCPS